MAKSKRKQNRKSISVSRATYDRLKAFCEDNHISMSQLVETRVSDIQAPETPLVAAPVMATEGRDDGRED